MRVLSSLRTGHYRVLAGLWTVGILFALAVPANNLPNAQSLIGFDKVVHVLLFAGFGGLWLRGLCPPDTERIAVCFRRRGGVFFVAGVLFAVGTELYQEVLPVRRLADPYDVTADLVGFVAAFVGYYVYHVRRADRASA
jgi:VanZ family protein